MPTSTSKTKKEKNYAIYRALHRTFSISMLVAIVLFIGGLVGGFSGWRNGFLLCFGGFILAIVIMPFYLIYRSRFLKAKLAVQMLQRYSKQ